MEISNKALALIVAFTILLSFFTTMTMLNRLGTIQQMEQSTGKASSAPATVVLQVSSTVSILLLNNTIDFGTGYVNDSCPVTSINNATLIAGSTYNDSDDKDCWTGATTPTSIHIENDGNQDIMLKVLGPTNGSYFSLSGINYPGTKPFLINFQARNYEPNSCDTNGNLLSSWIDFAGVNRTICTNFTNPPGRDQIAIDVKVVIPSDLPSGTYQNSTITFMAVTS